MNALRNQMTRQAVTMCRNDELPITIENVAKYLPGPLCALDPETPRGREYRNAPDFELGMDDLGRYVPEQSVESGGEAGATSLAESPAVSEPAKTTAPTDSAGAIAHADERCRRAERSLNDNRVRVITATDKRNKARVALAEAVKEFQCAFRPVTQEQLLRQHVEQQQQIRAAIARGEIAQPRHGGVGKSVVDRMAAAQRGGSPAGGGRAYARGAYPASAQGRRLPSQRLGERT